MSPPSCDTISSRKRLACRALRATSLMPFLLSSSSSSVTIGRNTSCSSKRKRLVGSCISTLVSSTKSLVTAAFAARGPSRSRSRLRGMGASACEAKPSASCLSWCREVSLRGSLGIRAAGWLQRESEAGGARVVEDFLRVAGHLHAPPRLRDPTLAVDHEGAALDAAHLAAVHDGVARDPEDTDLQPGEFRVKVAEIHALDGAAGSAALGIEAEDERGREGR